MTRHWPGDRGNNIPGGRNSLYKDTCVVGVFVAEGDKENVRI